MSVLNPKAFLRAAFVSLVALASLLRAEGAIAQETGKDQSFIFGVGIHAMTGWIDLGEADSLIGELGVNSFRDDLFWRAIENEKGILKLEGRAKEFADYVRRYSVDRAPIIILGYGNRHYGSGDFPVTAEALDAYARYCRYVAGYLGNGRHIFQVWNEWNTGLGLPAELRRNGTAKDYLETLRRARKAISDAAPEAIVISQSVARMDDAWIDQFVAGGGLKLVDGLAVNPYVWARAKDRRPEDAVAWLDRLQMKLRRANGGTDFPVYVTEIGWPNHHGHGAIPERLTAAYAVRFLMMAKARSWIRGVWWYDLKNDGTSRSDWEHNYGLVRADGAKKPIFEAFRRLAPVLIDGRVVGNGRTVGNVIEVTVALPQDQQVTVLWSKEGAESAEVVVNGKVLDLLAGRPLRPGTRSLRLTEEPIVLQYRRSAFQLN